MAIAIIGSAALFWPKQSCDAASGLCDAANQKTAASLRADTISAEVATGKTLLIDVREPDEYAEGHAKDARLIPVADVAAGKLNENDKDKKIYLYCHSGRRAGLAKTALEKQGYTNVESLGGLSDWEAIDGKVER